MIDQDRLFDLLARFENGDDLPGNPFGDDPNGFIAEALGTGLGDVLLAFSQGAADDTPSDDREQIALAGLIQGLAIGWQYATER